MADASLFSLWPDFLSRAIYDPTTNWQGAFSPRVVFNVNPQDMPIESQVLSRVGSYGSQLSTIIDVLDVLQSRLDRTTLDEQACKRLKEFDALRDAAQKAVDDYKGRMGPDEIAGALAALRKRDPRAADALVARIAREEPR